MGKPKLGSGGRFKALVGELQGKVENPAAVAASIGMKKYGKGRMEHMAAEARAHEAAKKAGAAKGSENPHKG